MVNANPLVFVKSRITDATKKTKCMTKVNLYQKEKEEE